MVTQKRLDYGFNGYQIPLFPRAPRSAKEKSSFKKESDKKTCPIELLAALAADLLQEGDSNPSRSNIADERVEPFDLKYSLTLEQQAEEKLLEPSNERVIFSDCSLQGHIQHKDLKEPLHSVHDMGLEHCSIVADSSCLGRSNHAEIVTGERNEFVNPLSKTEVGSTGFGASWNNQMNGAEGLFGAETAKEINNVHDATLPNSCSLECPMEWDVQPQRLITSRSSFEVPHSSFLPFQTNLKLVCKDNDENSSRCPLPNTRKMKTFRPLPRIVGRRIRRLLVSRYWKKAPKLNEWEHSENDMLNVSRNKKACYNRRKCQKLNLFGRKLFQLRLKSRSEKGIHNEASPPSLVAAPEASFDLRDSYVKFSIKSFRVPELFIEIPETATVGSLKRTVREAVSAILSGGLCVGVVLQGKQVRDDSKTLLQTGISRDDKHDALGFMLEPHPVPASATYAPAPACAPIPIPIPIRVPVPVCREDPSFLVSCDIPQPLARYSPTLGGVPVPSDTFSNPPPTNVFNIVEDKIDAILHPTDLTSVKSPVDSAALIANPNSFEALAAAPLPSHRKSRESELAQRRIRRPFFVSEVEALVQAVEKLGTGRWRDVKGFAFDDAKHRTYVDLKDKWKTLVHTARISSQQRRGEPVPQELLDRVLAAHAYWSRHQVKQQTETHLTSSNPIEERASDRRQFDL